MGKIQNADPQGNDSSSCIPHERIDGSTEADIAEFCRSCEKLCSPVQSRKGGAAMKKILKWVGIVVASLIVVGFLAFLYLIPPFDMLPREAFTKPHADAVGSSLDKIDNPVERALAERGRYIMSYSDCNGCHTPQGDQGPNWD